MFLLCMFSGLTSWCFSMGKMILYKQRVLVACSFVVCKRVLLGFLICFGISIAVLAQLMFRQSCWWDFMNVAQGYRPKNQRLLPLPCVHAWMHILPLLVRVPWVHLFYNQNVEDLAETHTGSIIVVSISLSLYEPRLVDFGCCVLVSLTPLVPRILLLFIVPLILCLVFGCESLHLLLSVAR